MPRRFDRALDAHGRYGPTALQYGPTEGATALREHVAASAHAEDGRTTTDGVLVTTGSQQALDLLAGPEFADAYAGSTNIRDYKWGLLHRIVLDHPLGGPFSIPPAGGAFEPTLPPNLRGIPVDGGFGVVDASSHSAWADGVNEFMFGSGPVRGFAVVHCIGILTSMFSAVFFSRGLVNLWYGRKKKLKSVAIGQVWKPESDSAVAKTN